ncbi:hypothetical protein L7F22_006220 [Adiantum nelumboides]|nr:hypothetical protein [Adiantum nelumboides]
MIKRQFYSLEHRSRDDKASSASSTSSSSAHEGSADSEPHSPALEQEEDKTSFPGSDPEASDKDGDANKAGNRDIAAVEQVNTNDDDDGYPRSKQRKKQKVSKPDLSNQWADLVAETLNEEAVDFADECVVSCKKVLKCRLCPKTICLSRESMQGHLVSKKHARSLKLLSEGRLKVTLNSDGEEEEQGETHAERHARILASFEKEAAKHSTERKRASGRQRQRRRAKNKAKKSKKNG